MSCMHLNWSKISFLWENLPPTVKVYVKFDLFEIFVNDFQTEMHLTRCNNVGKNWLIPLCVCAHAHACVHLWQMLKSILSYGENDTLL